MFFVGKENNSTSKCRHFIFCVLRHWRDNRLQVQLLTKWLRFSPTNSYEGNRRFRVIIQMNVTAYRAARTKMEKGAIVMKSVRWIRESCRDGGGFVRKDSHSGQWFEIGDTLAREKVGHAIRDAVKARQRSERKVSGVAIVPAPANGAALRDCPKATDSFSATTDSFSATTMRIADATPTETQSNSGILSPFEFSGELIDGFRPFHAI